MGKEQVTLRELRKDFYKIRKFEIQNLWQRSIFLATFTVLLFTGYGFLIEKLISTACDESSSCCSNAAPASKELRLLLTHLACSILAFLGIIFSMIWTMMAKGSKAWYEVYERKICNIEADLCIPEIYRMNPGTPWKVEDSLISRESGAYSVSKINVLLGQVLLIIWMIAFNTHLIILSSYTNSNRTTSGLIVILGVTLALALELTIPYLLKNWAKSGAIKKPIVDKREGQISTRRLILTFSEPNKGETDDKEREKEEEGTKEQEVESKEEMGENNKQTSRSLLSTAFAWLRYKPKTHSKNEKSKK